MVTPGLTELLEFFHLMNEIRNLYSVFSIQFLINHRSMGSDCVFADAQNRSYNTVSQALCNKSSDLLFSRRKSIPCLF